MKRRHVDERFIERRGGKENDIGEIVFRLAVVDFFQFIAIMLPSQLRSDRFRRM